MLSPEVQKNFLTIEEFSSTQRFGPVFVESNFERVLLIVIALTLIMTVLLLFVGAWQIWAVVSGLVFLLAMIALAIAQAVSALSIFRSPLRGYAPAAESRLKRRIEYIEQLAMFSPEGLLLASQTLEGDASRMKQRLYSLVGRHRQGRVYSCGFGALFCFNKDCYWQRGFFN